MRDHEDAGANAAFELAAGLTAVIAAGFVAAMMLPHAEPAGRAVVMAIAVGLIAAVCTDWRAGAGVATAAMLIFVGFLTHRYAALTGDPTPWALTPVIVFAALLGRGWRRRTGRSRIRETSRVLNNPKPAARSDRRVEAVLKLR